MSRAHGSVVSDDDDGSVEGEGGGGGGGGSGGGGGGGGGKSRAGGGAARDVRNDDDDLELVALKQEFFALSHATLAKLKEKEPQQVEDIANGNDDNDDDDHGNDDPGEDDTEWLAAQEKEDAQEHQRMKALYGLEDSGDESEEYESYVEAPGCRLSHSAARTGSLVTDVDGEISEEALHIARAGACALQEAAENGFLQDSDETTATVCQEEGNCDGASGGASEYKGNKDEDDGRAKGKARKLQRDAVKELMRLTCNGAQNDEYLWAQSKDLVMLTIYVPANTRSKDLSIIINEYDICVMTSALEMNDGSPLLFQGDLAFSVLVPDLSELKLNWSLLPPLFGDKLRRKRVEVVLKKDARNADARQGWWDRCLTGESSHLSSEDARERRADRAANDDGRGFKAALAQEMKVALDALNEQEVQVLDAIAQLDASAAAAGATLQRLKALKVQEHMADVQAIADLTPLY